METWSLQFQGKPSDGLMSTVLTAVVLTLAIYSIWQFIHRRWIPAVVCLAGALPGVAALYACRVESFSQGMWMIALGVQVAAAVAVFYAAVYAYLGKARLALLMVLRWAAVVSLLLILFKPAVAVTAVAEALKPYLPILVDRSGSMGTTDQGGEARYTQTLRTLRGQQDRLERYFRPVYYTFGDSLQAAESLDAMSVLATKGEGTEATNIAKAIRDSSARFPDKKDLAGLVLISDGLHNVLTDNVQDAVNNAGAPIFTLGVGSKTETAAGRKNLRIVSVDAPFEAMKNNITTITAEVKAVGMADVTSEVRLLEEGADQPAATATIFTDKGQATIRADMKWTPKDKGTSAPAPGETTSRPARSEVRKLEVMIPPGPAETTPDDKFAELHILVTEPRIRVLYIEGKIQPEGKFLRREMESDQNCQFMKLTRVEKNRFFAEGTINGQELHDLPRSDEDFRLFDVLILQDIDATFFTADQLARIRRFVQDGGGLLMVGGKNSFGPGGFGNTEVEAALPVVMGSRTAAQEDTAFVPLLTAAGLEHPIFENITGYFPAPGHDKPDPNREKLPELAGCVTVVSAKPGASVLAVHPTRANPAGPLIVLAVQQFGAGRSAALTCDTTWKWYMEMRIRGADSPYQIFWGQMMRWLANVQTKTNMVASSVVLRTDRQYVQLGSSVKIMARVQDEKGKIAENANVNCAITPVKTAAKDAQVETVPLVPKQTGGLYQASVAVAHEGRYVIKCTAVDSSTGATLGTDELPLVVAPHSAEMDVLARDEALLQQVAARSNGAYADLTAAPEIIDQIIDRQKSRAKPNLQGRTYKLFNFPLLFFVMVGLLTAEWIMRRNWQLQ